MTDPGKLDPKALAAEAASALGIKRERHPECTLERVRELEATIAAVRAVACAWDSAEGTYNPVARITRIREVLRAHIAPPPAAEPVTEQERAVLRAMDAIPDGTIEALLLPGVLSFSSTVLEALKAELIRRAAAREGKP